MTHFPQAHPDHRAPRIQLGNTTNATVKFDGGQQARAKIKSVSVTGGLLLLAKAIDEGDFVEIAFQTHSGPVQGMAEMLHPRKISPESTLQAFRFIALDDDHHKTLRSTVDTAVDRNLMLGSILKR
jgi:hypothetical protein